MGRTNPTYRDRLREFEERYQPFRRALRYEHQLDFDRLFERADATAHAASYRNATDPAVATLLSMLLAHEAEIRELHERLAAAEGHDGVADVDRSDDGDGSEAPDVETTD
ncbi:hypothetical protein [Haloarchaeobius litoreus]|uniref:DUF8156 domain-containing protein n=1 Tax=Haloarchaeobius litoreus TaxID=755306 RepID=A0ABD6DJ38_9EURY|nr:hypothetical protein [Haloarchaeobius litoreus]